MPRVVLEIHPGHKTQVVVDNPGEREIVLGPGQLLEIVEAYDEEVPFALQSIPDEPPEYQEKFDRYIVARVVE